MKRALAALSIVSLFVLAGCSDPATHNDQGAGNDARSLTILAAASLQEAFNDIAEDFTTEHPDVTIDFNYAGSSTLVHNLEAGAPADVLATADESNMDSAEQSNLIEANTRTLFAANQLTGIVPADNPANISTLEEANADGVNLVTCAPQVPCGTVATRLAEDEGITLQTVSEEQQVTDVLGKVRSGQADAGLVYATDAALAPNEVTEFDLEGAEHHLNYYPIAQASHSENAEAAREFINYVQSDAGQTILKEHGFSLIQN